MKKTIPILICFLFVWVTNAQEKEDTKSANDIEIITKEKEPIKETKEERRQRYINEGNPFKEFGYTPRIITLSNGKYKEFFTDTILTIGNFVYNRNTRQVTGVKIIDESKLSEATLKPDIVSRWMSPDPLSDEFPSWSPYTFTNDNPIYFTDPTGLAPQGLLDDYGLDQNGKITLIKKTDDATDTLYSVTRGEDGELVKDSNGEVAKNDTNGDGNVGNGDSVTVNKGILNNIENTTYVDSDNITRNIQIMDVTGSKNVKSLFEFVTGNSTNEVSYSSWFTNSKEFISTSFQHSTENSINILFPRYRYLLHHVHSHPDGSLDPSMANGDTGAAAIIERVIGYAPRFQIYSPFLKQYKDYNKNSTWELDEIIITAPKKKN